MTTIKFDYNSGISIDHRRVYDELTNYNKGKLQIRLVGDKMIYVILKTFGLTIEETPISQVKPGDVVLDREHGYLSIVETSSVVRVVYPSPGYDEIIKIGCKTLTIVKNIHFVPVRQYVGGNHE